MINYVTHKIKNRVTAWSFRESFLSTGLCKGKNLWRKAQLATFNTRYFKRLERKRIDNVVVKIMNEVKIIMEQKGRKPKITMSIY